MLTRDENEFLSRVGAGTPMGELLRRFWMPVLLAEELPEMDLGDFVYAKNIGAYAAASSTNFNGFPPAQIVHLNREVPETV